MRMHMLTVVGAAALVAVSQLSAQQQPKPADHAQNMAAMMCGGGMAGMMHGMSEMMQPMPAGEQKMPGMRMDSTKKVMKTDSMGHDMALDAKNRMEHMMAGAGPADMPMMMGPPPPSMILMHKAQIKLTADQVSRLEALQKDAQPQCMHHMQAAMDAHHAAIQLLDAAAPDFNAYSAKLTEATGHMVEGHVIMAKAAVQARDVLTADQRQLLKDQMMKPMPKEKAKQMPMPMPKKK